jgi:hypothetical protein
MELRVKKIRTSDELSIIPEERINVVPEKCISRGISCIERSESSPASEITASWLPVYIVFVKKSTI